MHLSQPPPMHADMCPRCTHALNQWRDRHVPPVSLHLLQVRDHCHTSHFCLLRAGTRPALTSHSISKSTPNVVSLPRPRSGEPLGKSSSTPGRRECWVLPSLCTVPPPPTSTHWTQFLTTVQAPGRSTPSRARPTVLNCTYSKMILGSIIRCLCHAGSSWPSGAPNPDSHGLLYFRERVEPTHEGAIFNW